MGFDFKKFTDDVAKGAGEAAKFAQENASKTAEAACKAAEDAGKFAKENTPKAVEAAGKAAEDAGHAVAEGANVAGKAIATGASEASKAIGSAANTAGNAIAEGTKSATKAIGDAIEDHKRRMYSPLFLDQYNDENFDMPKLVVVADEDRRKGIEMCEGAIGWLNTRRVPEIIFMYEEFVPNSNIRFYPRPICDASYYRHPFTKDLYIQVKDYLNICRANQLTELKNIASSLGAKHCCVEVHESKGLLGQIDGALNAGASDKTEKLKAKESTSLGVGFEKNDSLSIVMSESFESGTDPQKPELLWFADDFEILSLIEKRCNPEVGGKLSSYSIDITSSTSSTLSFELAHNIEASLGAAGISAAESLSGKVAKEEKKRFIYKIEF